MAAVCYEATMAKLEDIIQEIISLSVDDQWKLADWFAEHGADLWDKQIAEDAKAGRLDRVVAEALADLKAGRTTPL
jgi:hypothetical protein